ncbi:hypothetical protein ACIP6T_24245 [Pantoea sp. NPDC088449]|uniref:hypothetical protein n=1 Tax=Pantoea sp. NPDC088449 TaxID=3364392 RepID=UPI00381AAF8D
MNTQNVNTAASESSETWVKTPESVYFTRKIAALADLARLEGEMMAFCALERLGIGGEDLREDVPMIAQDRIEMLAAMGAISSPTVYELVCAADEMITELDPTLYPVVLPTLEEYKAASASRKAQCLTQIQETMKPFSVEMWGEKVYPDEFSLDKTYWTDSSIHLGRAWTVAQALELAKAAWLKDEWNSREEGVDYFDENFGRDTGPISFRPIRIVISDEKNNTVLTGDPADLSWHADITGPEEKARIRAAQDEMLKKARAESYWCNYETARQLRSKVKDMSRTIVDEAWQGHPEVIAAIAAFIHPAPVKPGGGEALLSMNQVAQRNE